MCVDLPIAVRVGMRVGMGMGVRVDMRADMCIDMRADVSAGKCSRPELELESPPADSVCRRA